MSARLYREKGVKTPDSQAVINKFKGVTCSKHLENRHISLLCMRSAHGLAVV